MKVATHTTKPTSPRSKLYHKRLLVLKLVVHYKKRKLKNLKYRRGIGPWILLKSKAKRWPISVFFFLFKGKHLNLKFALLYGPRHYFCCACFCLVGAGLVNK